MQKQRIVQLPASASPTRRAVKQAGFIFSALWKTAILPSWVTPSIPNWFLFLLLSNNTLFLSVSLFPFLCCKFGNLALEGWRHLHNDLCLKINVSNYHNNLDFFCVLENERIFQTSIFNVLKWNSALKKNNDILPGKGNLMITSRFP